MKSLASPLSNKIPITKSNRDNSSGDSCISDFIESEHNNLSMQQHHEMKINESMINRGLNQNTSAERNNFTLS